MASPCFAFGPYDCHFFTVPTGDDIGASASSFGHIPDEVAALFSGPEKAHTIYHAAWGENGSYYIGYQTAGGERCVKHDGLPRKLANWLASATRGVPLRDVEQTRVTLGPEGGFFATDGRDFVWAGLGDDLGALLSSPRFGGDGWGPKPKLVALGKDKATYILITTDGKMEWKISESYEALRDWIENEQEERGTTRLNAAQYAAFNIHYLEDFLIVFKEGGFVGEITEEQRMDCTTLCREFQRYLKEKEEDERKAKQKARPRTGLRETVLNPQAPQVSSTASTSAKGAASVPFKSPDFSTSAAAKANTTKAITSIPSDTGSTNSLARKPASNNSIPYSKSTKTTPYDLEKLKREVTRVTNGMPSSNPARPAATPSYSLGTGYGSNPFGLGSNFGLGSSFGTYGSGVGSSSLYNYKPSYSSNLPAGSFTAAGASGVDVRAQAEKDLQARLKSMQTAREQQQKEFLERMERNMQAIRTRQYNSFMNQMAAHRALSQAQLAWAQSLYQPYGSVNPTQQQHFHYLASLYGPGGSATHQQQQWANSMINQYTNNAGGGFGGGGANIAQNISQMTSGMDPNQVIGMTGMDPGTLMNLAGSLGAMGGACSIM